jgi:hypothetical protein
VQVFLCPATKNQKKIYIQLSPEELQLMRDFASPEDIDYSFRLLFDHRLLQLDKLNNTIIMTDKNPLFKNLTEKSEPNIALSPDDNLLKANSPNHDDRGQNVLLNDGHVEFMTDRYLGLTKDDIFTIQSATTYKGNEIPQSEQDVFVAP